MNRNDAFEIAVIIFLIFFLAFVLIGNYVYGTATGRMWICIILGIMGWQVLGCIVLAAVDRNRELYDWIFNKAPNGLYSSLAIFLFPIVVIAYLYGKRKQ